MEQAKRYFYQRNEKTHTILIPTMLPIHFRILGNVLENYGYHIRILDNCGRRSSGRAKECPQRYLLSAQLVIGQMMDALGIVTCRWIGWRC